MPKFTATFERRVVEIDQFTREIEADALADAEEQANALAIEADDNCPDDAKSVRGPNCEEWDWVECKEVS
jgi:hypothetical protein